MKFFILLLVIFFNSYGMEIENSFSKKSAYPKKTVQKIKCYLCKASILRRNLSRHLHNNHFNQFNECLQCAQKFATVEDYTVHMKLVEGTPMPDNAYQCSTCNELFESLDLYKKHDDTMKQYNKIPVTEKCPFPECNKIYGREKSTGIKYHLHNKHFNTHNTCSICNENYRTCVEYTNHCQIIHDIELKNNNILLCPTCNAQFDSSEKLKQHTETLMAKTFYNRVKKSKINRITKLKMSVKKITN